MPELVTVTFSPCIDKSASVSGLSPDIKMNCILPKEEPGGGGINVARAIHQLGGTALAMYVSGGCNGNKMNQLLEDEKIPTLVITGIHDTRENIIILDESNNKQYRFGMPMSPLNVNECQQFLTNLEAMEDVKYIIVSGSLPEGVPLSVYHDISALAKKKNARLIIDTKGDALKHALDAGVYLIKPNLGELSMLVGKRELNNSEIKEVARQIIQTGKCEVVVISLGAQGAMLVTSDLVKHFNPPFVKRKSTVGAGDSMVAGIVFSLLRGVSLTEAIRYGVACGTAATLNPGTALCRKEDVDNLYEDVIISDMNCTDDNFP